MAVVEVLLLVASVLAIIWIWYRRTYHYNYWELKRIPFIKPTPFIGNLKNVFTMQTSAGLNASDIYNAPEMADAAVVGIYLLHKPALIIREPELVKSILIKDFSRFNNRYSAPDPHRDPLANYNLFFVRNPEWKDIRTKVSPVFTSGKIKQMYPLMLEVGAALEKHLAAYPNSKNGFIAEVKDICALFTTDLIATIAFGITANSLQNPDGEFRTKGKKFFNFTLGRAFDFFVAFYLPRWSSFFRIKMFCKEVSAFYRKTINYVMDEREKNGFVRNDLIDILIALKKEAASSGNVKHFASNNDFLVAQAAVFFTAGFETSSSTMAFALYELAKRPDLQKRLRDEIHEALIAENGTISYEKISSLEYLGMVIDEVLRLYPVLPFLDREYAQAKGEPEYSLKPYHDYALPDSMPVYIPIYAIQRDAKYWPNPNTFDPERFSNENKKNHHPMTYLPFGTGPHNCIGSRIGLLQAKIGLVHILKNHYVTPCNKTVTEMRFDTKALVLQCDGGIYLNVVNDALFDNKETHL